MERARYLRRNLTPAERLLWQRLRARPFGPKVRRQVPIGPYIVDFAFINRNLVVEIDGDTHATLQAIRADTSRTAFLATQGFRVVRFSNRDVCSNPAGVIAAIEAALT